MTKGLDNCARISDVKFSEIRLPNASEPLFEVYEDKVGGFRFRLARAIEESETKGLVFRARFETYRDSGDEYRFRLIAANNEIVAVSQGYTDPGDRLNGIESVKRNASIAEILDFTS